MQVDLNEYAPKAANLFTSKQAEAQQKTESKGLAFLDDASLEEGAVQTDSGLVYLEVTAAYPAAAQGPAAPPSAAPAGSYPDRVFFRKLKNYFAGCFFPFHSLSKSQCF